MAEVIIEKKGSQKAFLYLALTKPGIVLGNLVTTFAGYAVGAKGTYHLSQMFLLLLGISCVIAAGCVFNNCFDVDLDKKMLRTKSRPLASGLLKEKEAFMFGVFLSLLGAFLLSMTSVMAVSLAFFGLFFYVTVYTFLKYVSPYATLIGAVPGAIPPLVGYAAATPHLDAPFFLLFLIIFFWQIPHFYAISLFRMEEFHEAKLPIFPIKKGVWLTKVHMLVFAILFAFALSVFSLCFSQKYAFLAVMGTSSLLWILQCFSGFWRKDGIIWARSVFVSSLVLILSFALSAFCFV